MTRLSTEEEAALRRRIAVLETEKQVLLRALRDASTFFRSEAKRGADHADAIDRTLALLTKEK